MLRIRTTAEHHRRAPLLRDWASEASPAYATMLARGASAISAQALTSHQAASPIVTHP
jgi:hypothetical protein